MTDKDLDLSGFQAERKVDVPPPPKKKALPEPKPESAAKKGKKKTKEQTAEGPASETAKPSKDRPAPTPRSSPKVPVAQPAAPAKRGRKKRVNVSLPVDLSRRFTDRAGEEDRYLTDMVLDAYRDHYAAMRDEHDEDLGDSDLPFRPRRRRAASGRVTHMLYLASPELAVLDGSADEIGLTRSEFVAQLLERELR